MALECLSDELKIELLKVLSKICLNETEYNKLVVVDYTINRVYLTEYFIKHWKITDEEFNTKFPIGIPEFNADSLLFKHYIDLVKEKNYPEFDEYVNTLDELRMAIHNSESEQIWIESVEMTFGTDKYNNPYRFPVIYIGGFVYYSD